MGNTATDGPVKTAVIPAAGHGRRMQPVRGRVPKELLPVAGRPLLDHVVDEALASGIRRICVVIRDGKEEIRRHLERESRCELTFVKQRKPNGLGDSLLCASPVVGDAPFAMLIPDQLFLGPRPPITQLAEHWRPGPTVLSSLLEYPLPGARSFDCAAVAGRLHAITGFATAPGPGRYRGFGRTIFPPQIFPYLTSDYADPATGEVDLLRTFQATFGVLRHYGVLLEGEAFDLGTPESYAAALPRLSDALA